MPEPRTHSNAKHYMILIYDAIKHVCIPQYNTFFINIQTYHIILQTNTFSCPLEEIILLVLLVRWLDAGPAHEDGLLVLEFFAGIGRIAKLAEVCGHGSVAYDKKYGEEYAKRTGRRSPMDINGNAGFVCLVRRQCSL